MDANSKQNIGKITVRIDVDLADMIPGFLANRLKDVELITEALSISDYVTIRTAGHNMKGSGGGYGFIAISDFGYALESGAKNQDGSVIRETLDNLKRYLDRVEVIYDELG